MIYDTTNNLDSSIFLKANLKKNFVDDNYYIYSLQEKRSEQWLYRSNVIDIEEEKEKQDKYSYNLPFYSPIEAVIQTAKDDKGQEIGDDWKLLSFENLNYNSRVGKRYRFSLDFEEFPLMSEEEKYKNSSIWITVNKNSNSVGSNILVQRCNSFLTLAGSKSLKEGEINIVETHYEPCILQTNMNYINLFYNQVLNLPQSDCYAIMQLNYYTNFIKINDRYFIGNVDSEDLENNHIYSVKAINKFQEDKTTFGAIQENNISSIPLIYIALDKSPISSSDNCKTRIAERTTIYKVEDELELYNEIYLKIENEEKDKNLLLSEEKIYTCNAYKNGKKLDVVINFKVDLPVSNQNEYYEFIRIGKNQFSVKNKKTCNKANLSIICSYDKEEIEYQIKLGGFY